MLNKREMADRLGVHEQTVDRWAKHGLIRARFYNDHGWQLYEPPGPNTPAKHCSRWDRLVDRAAGSTGKPSKCRAGTERGVV
jgi:predicted site-specific integrase-resolvase